MSSQCHFRLAIKRYVTSIVDVAAVCHAMPFPAKSIFYFNGKTLKHTQHEPSMGMGMGNEVEHGDAENQIVTLLFCLKCRRTRRIKRQQVP